MILITTNKYLITHQPAGSGTVTNITDGIRLTDEEGILTNADSFAFSVVATSKYDDFFNDNDNIKIYFWTDAGTPTLVMDGFVKVIKLDKTVDKKIWGLMGQNRLEILLNAPVPATYPTSSAFDNAAKIINNLIGIVNGKWTTAKYGPKLTHELKSVDSVNGKIDDTTNTLKTITYFRTDTPIFNIIQELSTPFYTGVDENAVGNYIYYVDSSNVFHWEPRSNTTSGTIEEGSYTEAKIEKSQYNVINFAVIDCGVDFNGKPIKTYGYGTTGISKGFKGKYFVMQEIAEQMKDPESFTTTNPWGNKDKDGNTNNGTFRNKVREEGKRAANAIVNTFGNPRYKANITFKGTTVYTKGGIYTVRINGVFRDASDAVADEIKLRIKNIQHVFNAKGWFTTLEMEQDEKTLIGGI